MRVQEEESVMMAISVVVISLSMVLYKVNSGKNLVNTEDKILNRSSSMQWQLMWA